MFTFGGLIIDRVTGTPRPLTIHTIIDYLYRISPSLTTYEIGDMR